MVDDESALLSKADKAAGSLESSLRVSPAHKRLSTDDVTCFEMEFRLVVNFELAVVDRLTKGGLSPELIGG